MVGFFCKYCCGFYATMARLKFDLGANIITDIEFCDYANIEECFWYVAHGIITGGYIKAEDLDLTKLGGIYNNYIVYTDLILPVGYKNIRRYNIDDQVFEVVPMNVIDENGRLTDKDFAKKVYKYKNEPYIPFWKWDYFKDKI